MKDIERTMVLAKSTLRLYISITLSHAEKGVVTQDEVVNRLRRALKCKCIVVSKEKHSAGGFHFHVAVKNAKHNAAKIIRSIFPEFDGVQCEVSKGWGCAYLTKEDKSPLVWGEYTREQILDISECSRHHKKDTTVPNQVVLDNLSKCEDWFDIYSNEVLVNRLFRYLITFEFLLHSPKPKMRSVFTFSIMRNDKKSLWKTIFTRFVLWTGRQIANFFLPGSGILITIVVSSRPQRAEAAGPSDCWTGEPDERLLRAMDKKLSRIKEHQHALAEKAVERGALFGMGLPGSPAEQKKSISTILENHLDTLDVDRRLREIRRWEKEEELGSPESAFWLMVVEEITKC